MSFQQLDLYKRVGQYDSVCYVTLVPDSPSFKKYGADFTGDFYYTKEERQELQRRFDEDDQRAARGRTARERDGRRHLQRLLQRRLRGGEEVPRDGQAAERHPRRD